MNKFMEECNEVVYDLRKKTMQIKKTDFVYLQKLYHLDDKSLKEGMETNSDNFKAFTSNLAERTFKKTNTMTYATVVRFLCLYFKLPYSIFIGFACLNKDKNIYESMQKDLSSHPFPVNHIYITVKDNELECFVHNRDKKKHYDDICHADFVVAEKHTAKK